MLKPVIQHMVQEDVGESRRNDPALWRAVSDRRRVPSSAPRAQPFVDHAAYHAVRDPQVKEASQVPMRDCVVVLLDIAVDHPPVAVVHDPRTYGREGVVGRLPGSEAV